MSEESREKNGRRGLGIKGMLILVLIVFIAGMVVARGMSIGWNAHKLVSFVSDPVDYGQEVRVIDTVETSLNDIGELLVLDYKYTILNTTKDPLKLFGKEVPFGGKEMTYLYSGNLRVGVDLSTAKVEEKGNTITLTFDKMIAHNSYDEDSLEFFDVKNYSFTKAKDVLEKYQEMRAENLDDVMMQARQDGVYENAASNLDLILTNQVKSILEAADVETEYEIDVVVNHNGIDMK